MAGSDPRSRGRGPTKVTRAVIGAAIEVHKTLGPGLLERVYQTCLAHELKERGHGVSTEASVPVRYKGLTFDDAYRADLVIDDVLVVEVKAVEGIADAHVAQTLTYMELLQLPVGLILNFNQATLRDGIKRLVR